MSKRKTRTVKNPLCGNVLSDQKDTKLDMFCTIDPLGGLYSEWFWEKVGLVAYDSETQAKYTWYILDIINYQQTNGDSTVPFATYHLALLRQQ